MKKRIFFVALLVAVLTTVLMALLFSNTNHDNAVKRVEEQLSVCMNIYEREYASGPVDGSTASAFSELVGARVLLLTREGIVAADSGGEAGADLSDRPEVQEAISSGEGLATGMLGKKSYIVRCRAFEGTFEGQEGYLLAVAIKEPSYFAAFTDALPTIVVILFIDGFVCLLVAWLAANFVLKPVQTLTRDAATNAGREVKTEVYELQPLAKMMNEMNADIDAKVAKMKEGRDIEKLILNSMEHGIVIFRSASDVLLINRTAAHLLDYEKNEPIRCFSEDREIAAILEEQTPGVVTRQMEGRDYSFRFTFKQEGNVLLITDVTETVAAARSKNDFIANVTHEMNTPLTSIRGFAELIAADGVPADRIGHAARTIIQQSDRLSNLIRRIINFSAIDSDALPDYEVDLSALMREVLPSFEPRFAEKGIVTDFQIQDNVKVFSRRERLLEIVNNLVSNGIRYNREGGSLAVHLTGGETPVLSVADTGVGLSEEDKKRIFDRFYTVDKSHNGQGGGFGLGLAIVKKLCLRAGWKLTVESELGKGTEFRIEFCFDKQRQSQ